MIENGVAINDLYAAALSQKPGIQQPANVHFTKEGSAVLAGQVAASIKAALQNRGH
jgi:acyl-CoA thioesterase-1